MSAFPMPLPLAFAHADRRALPLAGSRHLRWQQAVIPGMAGGAVAAEQLSPALRHSLTAPRPALCGMTLDRPRLMGILNVTPDSFSDGGRHDGLAAALTRATQIASEADIIDIGGESTRPGAAEVALADEIARVVPVIRAIRAAGITTPISIDTRKAAVAEAALDAGADLVNDVTALRFDPKMAALVAERGVPVCLMHSVADPATMQAHARYADVVAEVLDHLQARIEAALAAGIHADMIITDPGIGFGKTAAHDIRLLQHLPSLHGLGFPVLLGASRKKFIGALTGAALAQDRVAGSVAVALQGAAAGAQILRVHDTKETRQALRMWQAMAGEQEGTEQHVA